jgi:outer membrane protein TolC
VGLNASYFVYCSSFAVSLFIKKRDEVMKYLIFLPSIFLFSIIAEAQTAFFADLENFRGKSLTLKTEQQNLEAASDSLLSSQLFWTPKLSLSAVQTETRVKSVKTSESDYLEADATLNLYRAGSDWNKMQGRKAAKRAQELQVENEGLRVEVKASDLIFKSIYLYQSKKTQDDLLKLKEESLRIVNDRYHQGKLPLQEVSKSEVDLTQQKSRARQAALDLAENFSEMASLFMNDVQTKSWPFTEKTDPKIQPGLKIPTLEQKYWFNESQEQAWRSVKGGHWPSIDATIQYLQAPIKDRTTDQWVGTIQMTLPIWSQYETSATISSAFAVYTSALNDFKDTEQRVQQRALFLKEKIKIARINLSEAKANLEKAKDLYQNILRSFRLGRLSTNDLFLEQNRLFDSESSLAQSELMFHQALIETCALAGLRANVCLN